MNPDNDDINGQIKIVKDKWAAAVGQSEWKSISDKVEKDIAKAKNRIYKQEEGVPIKIKEEKAFKKLIIEEEEEKPKVKQMEPLEEEVVINNSDINEVEFKHFWAEKLQMKALIGKLTSEGKVEEAMGIAKETLQSCQKYISRLSPKFKHYQRLEAKIAELSNFIENVQKTEEKQHKPVILKTEKITNATNLAKQSFNAKDFPKNGIGFSSAYSSMKDDLKQFSIYLNEFESDELYKLFSKSEISAALLEGFFDAIVVALEENTMTTDKIADFVNSVPNFRNMKLISKMLKKTVVAKIQQTLCILASKIPNQSFETVIKQFS